MHKIREIREYPPIHVLFSRWKEEKDIVFFDSSLENRLGRYSIIGRLPYQKLVQDGDSFCVNDEKQKMTFENYLRTYLKEHPNSNESDLPIVSGAMGYISYDYGREKENVAARHPKEVDMPDLILCFYDNFIIEDHQEKRFYLVANGQTKEVDTLLDDVENTVAETYTLWKNGQIPGTKDDHSKIRVTPNFTKEDYKQAVQDMIDYIVEGDIYIANMTQHLTMESTRTPYDVFCSLRRDNPSPFGGYLNYGDLQIVSASPERFLQMRDGVVATRPIKGTRKRGATREEDAAMRKELEESDKDKSELLMIVDLERNDLNRVCMPGSVKVTEMYSIETYATVFHLVSEVQGRLAEDKNVVDLLEAAFPGGSITGAPKLRAMEIIEELEHSRRNLYTGSIGYLTLDGDCDFNIVIRTAVHKNGKYYLGVGGGITCESETEFEYEETLQKAKAVLQALEGRKESDKISVV